MDLTWYNTINKPVFTPPSEVFGPVWSVLYFLIFLSFFNLIKSKNVSGSEKIKALAIFFFLIQMVLNFLWSPVFFGLNNIPLSFMIICALLVFLFLTIFYSYKVSKLAALLLVPYIIWVCFATYLNYGIMILNTPSV